MNFLKQNISLLGYNTFNVDVTVPFFAEFANDDSLISIVEECKKRDFSFFVLGGGSNIIFTGGFQGVVIHPISQNIELTSDNIAVVDAGVEWDQFVGWAVENGLSGVENLSYIPGSVGASPVQNIGAYGAEAADAIMWVEYLDCQTMQIVRIMAEECQFGYRESIFKHELKGRVVIVRVAFKLNASFDASMAKLDYGDLRQEVENMEGGITLQNIRQAVTKIRKAKLPEPGELGSAGSFFKNPVIPKSDFEKLLLNYPNAPHYLLDNDMVKVPAGWLIDKAGWKGYRDGVVGVHQNQALVIVNYGGGTAQDILGLAYRIQEDIIEKFGIAISMEVNVL